MGEPIKFAVMGQQYVISGNIEPVYIAELADFVDQNMKTLYEKSAGISSERLAVLTAMNIADELFTLRKQIEDATKLAGKKIDSMIADLAQDVEIEDNT